MDSCGWTSSTRRGTTGSRDASAMCSSRSTCCDPLVASENTSTNTRAAWMAPLSACAKLLPGSTSRGAIQHVMPSASSRAQTASAACLSGAA